SPPSLAQQVLAHHAAAFAGFEAQAAPPSTRDEPVYLAALQACSALGVIAADAECLAQAWLARAVRTGAPDPAEWPTDAADFGLQAVPRARAFEPCPQDLGPYAVLPDAAWVGRMARAGVPTVQLRFKSTDSGAINEEVRAAVRAVEGTAALLFIN